MPLKGQTKPQLIVDGIKVTYHAFKLHSVDYVDGMGSGTSFYMDLETPDRQKLYAPIMGFVKRTDMPRVKVAFYVQTLHGLGVGHWKRSARGII